MQTNKSELTTNDPSNAIMHLIKCRLKCKISKYNYS